ncbi:unnamed protein product [Effrenium voratum]|nr:unnamed protein product [Effrenium voratum]
MQMEGGPGQLSGKPTCCERLPFGMLALGSSQFCSLPCPARALSPSHAMTKFLLLALTFTQALASNSTNGTLRGRSMASCGVAGAVDCGVCKCVSSGVCQWCNGQGGPAKIDSSPAVSSGGSSGSAASGLVNCGVCRSVPRSSCQWCDGNGGPASITSAGMRYSPMASLAACGLLAPALFL